MTARDTFGRALHAALTTRDKARRWGNRAHADAAFAQAVMAAADTYADARVADALAAGPLTPVAGPGHAKEDTDGPA
jgi:hypothetical protein